MSWDSGQLCLPMGVESEATASARATMASSGDRWGPSGFEIMSSTHLAKVKASCAPGLRDPVGVGLEVTSAARAREATAAKEKETILSNICRILSNVTAGRSASLRADEEHLCIWSLQWPACRYILYLDCTLTERKRTCSPTTHSQPPSNVLGVAVRFHRVDRSGVETTLPGPVIFGLLRQHLISQAKSSSTQALQSG